MADAAAAEGTNLFVGNITYNTGQKELEEMFSRYGTVKEARIAVDRDTGRSRGFGFVTMVDAQDAEEAVKNIHGTQVDGRDVRVEISTGRGGGGSGGGRGGGGGGFRDRGDDRRGGGRDDRRDYGRDRGDDRRGGGGRDDRRGGDRRSDDDRRGNRDDRRNGGSDGEDRGRGDRNRRDRSRDR